MKESEHTSGDINQMVATQVKRQMSRQHIIAARLTMPTRLKRCRPSGLDTSVTHTLAVKWEDFHSECEVKL